MKLKVDENDQAILVDGKPVYIGEDDKEVPVDVPALCQKITELNAGSYFGRFFKVEPGDDRRAAMCATRGASGFASSRRAPA